jgi:hypothetical protein
VAMEIPSWAGPPPSLLTLTPSCCVSVRITAVVSTEGADQKSSVLGCFQRIPGISVGSAPIHVKPG